jgi:hypothetical protein
MRRWRRRHEGDILQGKIKKIKPPTLNGENRKLEEALLSHYITIH